ncbi:hypothetical protein [Thiocapsa rosea]|uniref:Chemotaxis signal transduction protein n=1 Tax=Thiocapsa rosea TaxID=69360 RepID=A0A495V8V3_9GAMM|nr:hypothetical protein [Thiocapsa rosea]RKT44797.1 hypothetical protein BDD21_2201 [Thiocapsa rosea]
MKRKHEAPEERDDGGIDLILFSVGALRFAVASEHILGIADLAETSEAQVPALTDLLGLPRHPSGPASAQAHGARERLLRFRHTSQDGASDGAQRPGVRIEEPIALRRTQVDAIHPLPALMEALSELACVRGLVALSATNTDDLAILLDPRRLPEEACTAALGARNTTPARMSDQQRQGS